MLIFETELIGSDEALVKVRRGAAGVSGPCLDDELVRLANGGRRRITIDPLGLESFSSTELGILIGATRRARAAGARVTMTSREPRIAHILEITGFSHLFWCL